MSGEEYLEDQRNAFKPKNKPVGNFLWKSETWMQDVLKRAEQAENPGSQEKPAGAVSQEVNLNQNVEMFHQVCNGKVLSFD